MDRFLLGGLVSTALLCAGAGCSHLMETRTIQRFADGVQTGNLETLKSQSSPQFAEKALRSTDALQDLKILRLPDGKVSVVEVEEISPSRKRVTVEVGEMKKELFYEITKNAKGTWVVDDIYLRQKKRGIEAYKSVTEQMDLLLTVREFLDHWQSGDRTDIFANTTPEFRAALEQLPPGYLARVTGSVVEKRTAGSRYQPQAQMDEKAAVVRLPRSAGEVVLSLDLIENQWLVSDVAVDARDESQQIPSLSKLAVSVGTCIRFLDAYDSDDRERLKELAGGEFYEGALSVGNLKSVRLPHPSLSDFDLDVKLQGGRADFILKNDFQIVQINMHRTEEENLNSPTKFEVTDVTIYDIESKQEQRLAALFTSRAMLELFVKALAERDLTQLRHCTTRDFKQRIWTQLNAATMTAMPLELFDSAELKVTETTFQGSLTKILADCGGQPVTYLLREEFGRFYVDDILWQTPGRPASVKTTMELLIPVANFAAGVAIGRDAAEQGQALDLLRRSTSEDFNRMVWSQAKFLPDSGFSADTFMSSAVKSMTIGEKQAELQLGDARFGAQVRLVREYERWLIDEVVLIAGSEDADRLAVKQTFRNELARGEARPPEGWAETPRVQSKPKIQQVSAVVDPDAEPEDPFAETPETPEQPKAPRLLPE